MNNMFEKLDILKRRIQDEVLLNQNILKLIKYTDDNPLEQPDVEDVQELINKNIFFRPIVYDTVIQEVKTFFVLEFHMQPTRNKNDYIDMTFEIRIIMHNTLMNIDVDNETRTRAFVIGDELNKAFNNTKGSWMGNCNFKVAGDIQTAQDYYGIILRYEVTDFKK